MICIFKPKFDLVKLFSPPWVLLAPLLAIVGNSYLIFLYTAIEKGSMLMVCAAAVCSHPKRVREKRCTFCYWCSMTLPFYFCHKWRAIPTWTPRPLLLMSIKSKDLAPWSCQQYRVDHRVDELSQWPETLCFKTSQIFYEGLNTMCLRVTNGRHMVFSLKILDKDWKKYPTGRCRVISCSFF